MKKISLFILFLLAPTYLFGEPIYLECKKKDSDSITTAVLNLEDGYLNLYGANNKLWKTTEDTYHFFLNYPEMEHNPSWAINLNRITLSMHVLYTAFSKGNPTGISTGYQCVKSERKI